MSFYPTSWEQTPITIQKTSIGYDGIDDTTTSAINVRMVFKNKRMTDEHGHEIVGNGYFYKTGELEVAKGDNFTVDSIEYTIKGVYKARTCDGNIEYTKCEF